MKRIVIATIAVLCALAPRPARADDGGWLDWLFRMDPKFVGYTVEFHARCFADDGRVVKPCEDYEGLRALYDHLAGKPFVPVRMADVRHEINFRISGYWTHGETFPNKPDATIRALKLVGDYQIYFFNHIVKVGAGAGVMPFFGKDVQSTEWTGVFPVDVVLGAPLGHGALSMLVFRTEYSFITRVPTLHPGGTVTIAGQGEGNWSMGVGVDFRRR